MISNLMLILLLVVAVVVVGTLLAYIWVKDPFKAALGSCLSSLAVLVGSLGVPDVKGTADLAVNFGIGTFNSKGVAFSTGTPPLLWVTAFISIAVLVSLFALLLFLNGRQRSIPVRRTSGTQANGGLGGDVF